GCCKTCPGKWVKCTCKEPDQVCCRKVKKEGCTYEQVACTNYVKRCVCEQVPYTVCEKVPYTVVKKVPCTVCKMVKETCVKKVPYTVQRMETCVVKKQVPYTVVKKCLGAYVDEKGTGYDCEGPGRSFKCGAQVVTERVVTTQRMVQENCVKK